MIYGFIGTGTITEAMVEGMVASSLDFEKIVVSPRNAETAARLAEKFDKVVEAESNQAVARSCDVIVLAVRPQIAEVVLSEISISPDVKLISVIAATSHEKLAACTGHSEETIVRAIPLPFVSFRDGVTAVFPSDPVAEALFNAMGTAVTCATKHEFDLLAAASSTMGTYFGILERLTYWLKQNGMEETKAQSYLLPLFGSLAQVSTRSPEKNFRSLREEFSTKGGLNEQVFRDFDLNGGSNALTSALDNVLNRITT